MRQAHRESRFRMWIGVIGETLTLLTLILVVLALAGLVQR